MLRLYRRFLGLLGLAAGLGFLLLAALVGLDVALRNASAGGLAWGIEVVEYALYGATFLAAPWVLSEGDHVRVDVLLVLLGPRWRRALGRLSDLLGLVISLLLVVYGFQEAREAYVLGTLIFKELIVPEWPLLAILPFGAALLGLEFGLRLLGLVPDPGGEGVEDGVGGEGP